MAGTPARTPKSSTPIPPTKLEKLLAQAVSEGMTIPQLANKLAKKTGGSPRYWRAKLRRLAANSNYVIEEAAMAARGRGLAYLGPSVEGVGRRAARGRPDAAKLLWAMMGFHNDKVQHEHSGGIDIRVSIPRPQVTEDKLNGPGKIEEGFVDADVVEDES